MPPSRSARSSAASGAGGLASTGACPPAAAEPSASSGSGPRTRGSAPEETQVGGLTPGQAVTIRGLRARGDLNGQKGVLQQFSAESGRWRVRVDATREVCDVKSENLEREAAKLFVHADGSPMQFYVPPCPRKEDLAAMVVAGGGVLAKKAGAPPEVFVLLPDGADVSKLQGKPALYPSFVEECAIKQQRLSWQDFVVSAGAPARSALKRQREPARASAPSAARPAERAPAERQHPPVVPAAAHSARCRGRVAYTLEDDHALKDWVRRHFHMPPMGKKLWERAERAGITRHSWQSMLNRYKKRLHGTAGGQAGVRPSRRRRSSIGGFARRQRASMGLGRRAGEEASQSQRLPRSTQRASVGGVGAPRHAAAVSSGRTPANRANTAAAAAPRGFAAHVKQEPVEDAPRRRLAVKTEPTGLSEPRRAPAVKQEQDILAPLFRCQELASNLRWPTPEELRPQWVLDALGTGGPPIDLLDI